MLCMLLVESWEEPCGDLGSIYISVSSKLWERTCCCFNSPGKVLLRALWSVSVCAGEAGHNLCKKVNNWLPELVNKVRNIVWSSQDSILCLWSIFNSHRILRHLRGHFLFKDNAATERKKESTLHGTLVWKREQIEHTWLQNVKGFWAKSITTCECKVVVMLPE